MLESVNADPDQPQEISRRFDLDKTLTWRISRVVREEDAWEAVQHIPRRPSFRLLVKAMEKHGAPSNLIDQLWQALEEFERFVETHSGDRETLEIMSSSASKRTAEKRLEAFRKSGFQASSAIWGVRAKLHLAMNMMAPAATPGMLSMATVCGFMGFRRLRANTPWSIATMRGWHGETMDDTEYHQHARPLRADTPRDVGMLLTDFCSEPRPEIEIVEKPVHSHRYMLKAGPVGNTGAANIFLGWKFDNAAPIEQTFSGETGDHVVMLMTPAEELVHDFVIHKSLGFGRELTAHMYSQLPGGPLYPQINEPWHQLPVSSDIADLGEAPPELTPLQVPNYREMVDLAARSLGYTIDDFCAFRYRLSCPPIPAASVLRHPLLKPKPG